MIYYNVPKILLDKDMKDMTCAQTNEDDTFRITLECHLGGGFKHFFMFNPTWGNDPIGLIFFRWVETTNSPTSHLSWTYNNLHKPPALYVSWPSTKPKTWPGWNRMCRSSWHFWESIITISPPRMSSIASEHSKSLSYFIKDKVC